MIEHLELEYIYTGLTEVEDSKDIVNVVRPAALLHTA